jgi:hypothetical protein
MPVRPKKLFMKRGAEGVSEDAYEYYTFGPFFDGEDWAKNKTPDELQAFWNKHRQAIMDRYLADMRRRGWAGHRPDHFWSDLKEPRLKTGTREYYKTWPDREKYIADVFETDYEFLKRLGLLEPWELESKKVAK